MRLVYLVHQFFPRHYMGTERLTLDLASQMQKMGHHPTVITYEPDPTVGGFESLTNEISMKRYTFNTIPVVALRHSSQVSGISIFHSTIEEASRRLGLQGDLVHMCHPMWLSSIARAYKNSGVPVVMTLTDSWLLCPRGLLDRGSLLCNGPERGEKCKPHCGLDLKGRFEDAKILYYMIDEIAASSNFLPTLFRKNGWSRSVNLIRDSLDYRNVQLPQSPPPKLTFGFIGSIAWHKGIHVLVKAARTIPQCDFRIRIYGSKIDQWDYFSLLQDLASEDSRIEFLGPFSLETLPDIMRDISVIVIPSTYYENYPLVMLIAMAYKVPVIASNIGGMPEVIKDGVNGFTFEVGNYEELAGTMERIAKEPSLIDDLRSNIVAPRRTEEEALDYENLYRKLVR